MPVTFATFERLKNKGVSAYRQGEYAQARPYLIQAAECMLELAEAARSRSIREQHEAYARELIDLARDCDRAVSQHRPAPRVKAGEGDDGGANAADWIVRDKPDIGFDDIAGLEDVKDEIRLKMIYPFQHAELAQRYGIRSGGGVLLFGPPGTGKTMLAKAIAHEIEATFFTISPAQVLSKWVGEAEQNVAKLFAAAKAEPRSIIFIDEIEALVPRRKSDTSTVMQRVVPQILQELEGFDRKAEQCLLFVGATNRPWLLDEAMLRPGRFDARVYIPLPDGPARYRLLEMYLIEGRPIAEDVDLGQLCDRLDGYSGADIKNIADRAASRPFMEAVNGAEARPITMADVLEVMSETLPSVNKTDLARFEQFAQTGQ
ncbi:MAG: ATP-binding protein [Planctomycetes bacterium]|nr:ATP-binding protein [Planctomycetota bacterium]